MSRDYLNSASLTRLRDDVSERDLAIMETVARLRLVSADQIQRLHFPGDPSRNRRRVLQSLTDRRLVARLDRVVGGHRSGSAGYLYRLDVAGLQLLATRHGRRLRRPSTPGAPFIRHVLATSELYVGLTEASRQGAVELLEFQAEPAAWRPFPGRGGGTATLKPDAYVRLGLGEYEDSWFVEIDRGSESQSTIAAKLGVYRAYWSSGREQARRGVFPRVLWLVPSERRRQLIVDTCSRQPAESWQLHQVTLFDDAVGLMAGLVAS